MTTPIDNPVLPNYELNGRCKMISLINIKGPDEDDEDEDGDPGDWDNGEWSDDHDSQMGEYGN